MISWVILPLTLKEQNMTQPTTRHIQAYSLLEYTQKLNEALNEGYELKLDTNEGTCQHIGFYFEVLMYKVPEVDYQELDKTDPMTEETCSTIPDELENKITKVITKMQPQKQRGRPSAK